MSIQQLETEFGHYTLQRWPIRDRETLQAWDAADEYLLRHYAELNADPKPVNIVILNDAFGALATVLHAQHPQVFCDSYLAQQAAQNNLTLNQLNPQSVSWQDSLSLPASQAKIDFLLIKVPKTLAFLEYQLHRLRPWLKPETKVLAAAMVKHLTPAASDILARLIGPVQASLAWKKARLLTAQFNPNLALPDLDYLSGYQVEQSGLQFLAYPNVFARERLDIGSRFLLDHLPNNPAHQDYVDLGCGNGVIGVHLAQLNPMANLCFVDESFMAIASARANFQAAFAEERQAQFYVGDGLSAFADASVDCVVLNPPFHQQHTIGDQTAVRLFQQAHRVLRRGGELRVIGNRHLNYPVALKKLFANCQVLASNPKFVIMRALKR